MIKKTNQSILKIHHFNGPPIHQVAIIPNMFDNKSNIYERAWSKFDQENFIQDYFSVDWEDLLKMKC